MAKKQNIDDLIREKLYDFKQVPSPDIWTKIESELHPEPTIEKNKPASSYLKYAGLLLIIFSVSIVSILIIQTRSGSPDNELTSQDLISEQYYNAEKSSDENSIAAQESEKNIKEEKYIPSVNSEEAPIILHKATTSSEKSIITKAVGEEVSPIAVTKILSGNNIAENKIAEKEDPAISIIRDTEKITKSEVSSGTNEVNDINISVTADINPATDIVSAIPAGNESVSVISVATEESDPALQAPALCRVEEKTSRYLRKNTGDADNIKHFYYKDLTEYSPQINLKGMSFGVAGSYNQTSLLENSNIFKGDKPIQPSLKFGTSKGVSFAYNFSNKFGIQADYIYNSVQGQNYVLSEDETIIQKTLALYYNQIPVTVKLKVPRIAEITQKPFVTNYIAGIQYDMLNEYRIPQEKRISPPAGLFKKDAISFIMGIDYDIYLSKQTYITLGARTSISNDISSHMYPLDDYAKHNFVFGLRAGFNYTFRNY